MPINLLTNTAANGTLRSLGAAQKDMYESQNRISSGLKVATARDNVAANAIITRMSTLLAGYKQAITNTAQANTMLETANGGLSEMTKTLQRMKELALQASSSNVSTGDKAKLNQEFQQLSAEADRLAQSTKFNGKTLLSGQTTNSTNRTTIGGALLGNGAGAGNGIASLQFDDGVQEGAYTLSYVSTGTNTGTLNLKNLQTGVQESVYLNNGAITAGTESYRFVASGATISLNQNFNKGQSFGLTDAALANTATIGVGGTGAITANTANCTYDSIAVLGSTGYLGDVNTNQIALGNLGVPGNISLTLNTAGTALTGNVDLSATGTKTVTLQRSVPVAGSPNRIDSLTIQFTVGTVFNGAEGASHLAMGELLNMVSTQQTSSNTASFTFQVGTTTASTDSISTTISSVTAARLGLSGLDLTLSPQTASAALDTALEMVSSQQANIGAVQNRLSAAASNLEVASENFKAARAVLAETDIGAEMSEYVRKQILTQTGVAMLGKNNETLTYVLRLLS